MSAEPPPNKISLRNRYKKIRNDISEQEAIKASKDAGDIFYSKFGKDNSKVISTYFPINKEIDPLYLINKLREAGFSIALPVITSSINSLIFKEWLADDTLIENKNFKTFEPPQNNNTITVDILIIPLLAFDKDKYRLGYGGGFYDKTLAGFKGANHKCITVGYAYEKQYANFIPNEDHDMKLDFIITNKKVY